MKNKRQILGEHVAFVDTADGLIVHPENEIAIEDAIFAAMEDYAKQVLGYVLNRNHPDYELQGERIVMQEGCFWWISDEDGDDELTEERIIKLYENDKGNNNISG